MPPTILSTYPTQNALNVPLDTVITVTFDQAMSQSYANANTFVVNGSQTGKVNGTYDLSGDGKTFIFSPSTGLKVGEVVSVTLTTGVTSTTGDTLASAFAWSFTIVTSGGSGVFRQTATLATGSNPVDVVAGDWNGDGNVDLAVSGSYMDYYVRIWTNDGIGGFPQTSSLQVDNGPYALAAGDWDEDGDQDLAVTQEYGSSVTI
ncbi:unnamed protein product, partial [marine sediment metagenome]